MLKAALISCQYTQNFGERKASRGLEAQFK